MCDYLKWAWSIVCHILKKIQWYLKSMHVMFAKYISKFCPHKLLVKWYMPIGVNKKPYNNYSKKI